MPPRDGDYMQNGEADSDVEIMEPRLGAPRLSAKEKGKGRASQLKKDQAKPKEVPMLMRPA